MYITYCTGAHFAAIHNILSTIDNTYITSLLTLMWYVGTKEDEHVRELMASALGSEDRLTKVAALKGPALPKP
jgi:hypothetical protein